MAYSVIETRVANPARKKKKKNMAHRRKLSAKQIRAGFGGKRRQNAARHRKPKYHKPRRHAPAARRSNPPRRKKRISHHRKRRNPTPEIITFALGNPGRRKGKKKMASRKRYRKAASKTNAGRRHYSKRRRNPSRMHHRRRRNPAGLGRPMDWIKGGVGVIGGGVGTRIIPQFAGSMNTGGVGYLMNGITALALAWGTHAFTKDAVLTASVAAGGFAALILRIVGDLTPYGSALSLSGFGDYMVSNWVTPQRIINPNSAMWEVPSGWGTMPSALPAAGMMAQSGADARTSGNSY